MASVRIPRPRRCWFVGHVFPVKAEVVGDEAPCWTCRRCGHKRWTRPSDFWTGAGHLSGGI